MPVESLGQHSHQDEYCQTETFRPRCLINEAIIMKQAVYGRMSKTGRCLKNEEELPTLVGDPKYLGCSENVLDLFDRRCSGKFECEIRIPDPELQQTSSCYKHMFKYLKASYRCVRVVQPDRSCHVVVSSDDVYLSSSSQSNGSSPCGSRQHPWILEAPSGQRINISLLDFTRSSSQTHQTQSRDEGQSSCDDQYGYIEDKSAKRNSVICGDRRDRERQLYLSTSNQVTVVLTPSESRRIEQQRNFLISFRAVGCLDLVPPADAWLKRTDNEATVGCYMTQQTWILTCDETGRWKGIIGNCTQYRVALLRDDVTSATQLQDHDTVNVVILIVIAGISIIICVVILCLGVSWMCRNAGKRKFKQLDPKANMFYADNCSRNCATTGYSSGVHHSVWVPTSTGGRNGAARNDVISGFPTGVSDGAAQYFILDPEAVAAGQQNMA